MSKTVFFNEDTPYICMSGAQPNQILQLKSMISRNSNIRGIKSAQQTKRPVQELSSRLLEVKRMIEEQQNELGIELKN